MQVTPVNTNISRRSPVFLLTSLLLILLILYRTLWKKCCFSGDGEYIVAGSYQEHALYIWDKENGSLVKILSGQKGENMLDVVWHPIRPIITSISNGMVHIWDQNQVCYCED